MRSLDSNGILRVSDRVYALRVGGWVRLILEEAHYSRYSIYPRATTMYHNLKKYYQWGNMKKDIVELMDKCLNYNQAKYEHQ